MWQLEDFWSIIKILFSWILVYCQAELVHFRPCSLVSSGQFIIFYYISLLNSRTYHLSPMYHVGRLSLQNKTCSCWYRHYPVQTCLSVLLIFSTLHIYFVPFHCSNGQNCSFQLTTSQFFFSESLFNLPISWVWELFILWIQYLFC